MTDYRIALTTCGAAEDAAKLARALVERKLAACVNVIPGVRSFYVWNEEVHDDAEHLLVIKTTADAVTRLEAAVRELHTYILPEFVVLEIGAGSDAYLEWIAAAVAPI